MSANDEGLAPEYSVAYPPERLVGREKEQEAIRQAVQNGVRVVYIEGGAGIGKTRLLSEADRFINLDVPLVILDVVDFYDTAMHGSLALEEALARQIQQRAGEDAVRAFLSALERYRVGMATEGEVHSAFAGTFGGWLGERWAVLRFDTAEFLEYGQDAQEVLEECEVLGEEVSAARWLQERLPALERVTALIAARPTRVLRQQLEGVYSEDLWVCLPLTTLSLEETRQYFQASEYGREVEEDMIERVWLLTDGRPILLSLTIDWLARGVRVDEIYDADVQELQRLSDENSEAWAECRQRFEEVLVKKIRLLSTPTDAVIYYAARARKGFTAEMLRHMLEELSPRRTELTQKKADELMESLTLLSFVKHPYGARPGWFFLHDEMYELLDRYVWKPDYPTYIHQEETARFVAGRIYGEEDEEGLIGKAAKRIGMAETHMELLESRRQLDILHTEQLFYRLEADPAEGYRLYDRLNTQALSQRRHEWDDMLHIEALRFIRTLPERARQGDLVEGFDPQSGEPIIASFVNRDCRARWVHRFFARGNLEEAERTARHLLDLHPDWDGLWKARILIGCGAALTRMGQPESTALLQEALQILEQPQLGEDPWAIRHYTATAYLYLGLQARSERDMKRAAKANEKAQSFFKENDEPIGAARALNNLAYVMTRQGRYGQATQAARGAADLRRELGDGVGLALSFNTLAIAEDRAGTFASARTHASEALSLLRRAEQIGRPGLEREIAMVRLNLGRIRRHLAKREGLGVKESVEARWQRIENDLMEALKRQDALEPYYRFELYNQLGMLYTRWANWIAIRMPEDEGRYRDLMRRANEFLEQADRFGRAEGLRLSRADSLEDWAWVFHLRRAYWETMGDELEPDALEEEVFKRLQEAEALVQEEADSNEEGLQAQYIAGSVHHQWGRYVHKFKNDVKAALRHYALSVAYYSLFSPEPLERKDRVLEHIENTLSELPGTQVRQLIAEMLHALEEKRLKASELRRWLEDIVADMSLH